MFFAQGPPSPDYFFRYDIPRLKAEIMSTDQRVQAQTASEIAALVQDGKIARRCVEAVPPAGACLRYRFSER